MASARLAIKGTKNGRFRIVADRKRFEIIDQVGMQKDNCLPLLAVFFGVLVSQVYLACNERTLGKCSLFLIAVFGEIFHDIAIDSGFRVPEYLSVVSCCITAVRW